TLRLLNVTFLNRNIVFVFFGPLTQTLLYHNRLVVQRLGLAVLVPQMGENSVNLVVGDKRALHASDVAGLFLDYRVIVASQTLTAWRGEILSVGCRVRLCHADTGYNVGL